MNTAAIACLALPRTLYRMASSRIVLASYVHGIVHTNTIEGFWSLLKRCIMGSYHKVSNYLSLYLSEFTYRHNRRHDDDPFAELISNA